MKAVGSHKNDKQTEAKNNLMHYTKQQKQLAAQKLKSTKGHCVNDYITKKKRTNGFRNLKRAD